MINAIKTRGLKKMNTDIDLASLTVELKRSMTEAATPVLSTADKSEARSQLIGIIEEILQNPQDDEVSVDPALQGHLAMLIHASDDDRDTAGYVMLQLNNLLERKTRPVVAEFAESLLEEARDAKCSVMEFAIGHYLEQLNPVSAASQIRFTK
jgi:hypothetical protein